MSRLADHAARDRIRADLDATFVVEAAAGTGKTTALVDRIVAVLETGRGTLDRLIALTFTEKAAGEMKLRLRARLEEQRTLHLESSAPHQRLTTALQGLEAANVGTIHGFCSDLLHERPVEAGVDPRFEVIGGDEERALLDQVFEEYLHDALEAPGEGLRRALRRNDRPGQALQGLRSAALALIEQRDFGGAWTRPDMDRGKLIDSALEALRLPARFADRSGNRADGLATSLAEIENLLRHVERDEQNLGFRDDDALEYALRKLLRSAFRRKGYGKWYGKEILRQDVLSVREEARQILQGAVELLEGDLAACLQHELQDVVARYEMRKAESGRLDYLDLLLRTRDLLRDDPGVRQALQERYRHVFVDEFQDIDPLQAEVIGALCGELDEDGRSHVPPGKLFVVGDPKQAIYRFRRADLAVYERVKRDLQRGGAEVLQLTTSFRSRPEIQSVVNHAFSEHMVGSVESGQAHYQPLCPYRESADPGSPAVVALPIPGASARGGFLKSRTVAEKTPAAVAAFIEVLLRDDRMKVIDESGQSVRVEARHVCLLFRRFQSYGEDVTRPYVRALEARGIPHVLVGGRSFHLREEVIALRSVLRAIEWPDDHLHLYATLRGPFVALSDEALFAYRERFGTLNPLRVPDDVDAEQPPGEVAEALRLLKRLHVRRNRRPVADSIFEFLEATRAHAGVAIWPTGEQALANLMRVVEVSRQFELRGATSFRAFVEWLAQSAERGDMGEAPVIEEGTEGVRMMTVHTAKGLEFPVAILCDPTAPRESTSPSRYVDFERRTWAGKLCGCAPLELLRNSARIMAQDEAEEIRIGYVAATRARDLLVVPVVDDQRVRGWLDPLHRALYPRISSDPPIAPPPTFEVTQRHECALRPGFHVPERGEHHVLIWDSQTLDVDRLSVGGLRQKALLVEDPQGRRTAEALAFYERWKQRKRKAIEQGSAASWSPVTVTALSHERVIADAAAVGVAEVKTVARRQGRPTGKRFGTLVHAVLADAQFDADPKVLHALASFHGRILDANEDEVAEAALAVATALQDPLLSAARASSDARFELPISQKLPGGRLVEGVIDLLFRDDGDPEVPWRVVDFKTDADPGAVPEYAAQVALYAAAVEAALGERTRALLLAL